MNSKKPKSQHPDIEGIHIPPVPEKGLRTSLPGQLKQAGLPLKYAVYALLLLFMVGSCGNWGWEAIDTDNEEKLNIFGLISLDDSLQSFVVVHKTLDTAGPSEEIVGYDTIYYETWEWYNKDTGLIVNDTFWYNPPYIRSIRESLYAVKDASVRISDRQQTYTFVRSPNSVSQGTGFQDYRSTGIFSDPGVYLNIDGSFVAQPNTEYSLDITTPSGHHVQGSLTTPALPRIKENELADTLLINSLFDVNWVYDGSFHTTITTGYSGQNWDHYICGMEQFGIIEPGDTTWRSSIDSWCLENTSNSNDVAPLDIRLRYLDENYYRYFLASDDGVEEISNFLIGEGSIGTTYGLEGGYGVFGAMSADWTQRYATP